MRYVDKDKIEEYLPSDWDERARAALEYVEEKMAVIQSMAQVQGKSQAETEKLVKKARANAIAKKAELWSYAGQHIRNVMHDKCWYCESYESRSDMPVDHFRPKSSVAECPDHPGYWWLTFDWENYRFSCTYCNSRRVDVEGRTAGGKQDHFPVFSPPGWALSKDDDWRTERPVLLDPTNPDDTHLITFHENGFPRETVHDEQDEEHIRARESIRFYHLDHQKAVRDRKRIAVTIRNHFVEVERLIPKMNADTIVRDQIKFHKKQIIKLVREDATYCTAARVFLQGYRACEWVQAILERNL